MSNDKVVGPGDRPAKLLKSILYGDGNGHYSILEQCQVIGIAIWQGGGAGEGEAFLPEVRHHPTR